MNWEPWRGCERRFVACSPLLGPIDLSPYLNGIDHVTVSGETGREARLCDYEWVLAMDQGSMVSKNPTLNDNIRAAGSSTWYLRPGKIFFKQMSGPISDDIM